MVDTAAKKLTKAEFWALADAADITYELIDGIAVPKMSPKYFHARSARRILNVLEEWAKNRGRAESRSVSSGESCPRDLYGRWRNYGRSLSRTIDRTRSNILKLWRSSVIVNTNSIKMLVKIS